MINRQLNGTSAVALAALKIVIRHGILVMRALGDVDVRYRQPLRSTWAIATVDDPNLAYAYSEVKTPRLVPSPRDITRAEIIDGWLVWLRSTEGRRALYRVLAWARGVPIWLLAQQEKCSSRTITNRIDRSMAAILAEFFLAEATVERVEEAAEQPVRAFHGSHTSDVTGAIEGHGKVFIDGVGFMKDGRRLRDGMDKADAGRLYRDRPRG